MKDSLIGSIVVKSISDDDALRMFTSSLPSAERLIVLRAKKFVALKPMIYIIGDDCYIFATDPFFPLCKLDKSSVEDSIRKEIIDGKEEWVAFCELSFHSSNSISLKVYENKPIEKYRYFYQDFEIAQNGFNKTFEEVKDRISSRSITASPAVYPEDHSSKAVFTMMQELTDADLRKLSESILDDARLRNFFTTEKEESNEVILEELPEPKEPEPIKKRELPKNFGAWGS